MHHPQNKFKDFRQPECTISIDNSVQRSIVWSSWLFGEAYFASSGGKQGSALHWKAGAFLLAATKAKSHTPNKRKPALRYGELGKKRSIETL